MKYIRLNLIDAARDTIVLFDKKLIHSEYLRSLGIDEFRVRSAGFVRFSEEHGLECYGESTSLRCKGMPSDTERLHELMNAERSF